MAQQLAESVRSMIVEGEFEAGTRINEVQLSARLHVSRTPLREALVRLVAEGTVVGVPRLGFYAAPMTREEVEHLYPLRAVLDPAALRMAGLPSPDRLARLKRLNARFARATDPAEAVRLDDEWHLSLIEGCGNPVLLGFIEQMMWRTRRYELGLMRSRGGIETATGGHDLILSALEAGDLDGACAALEENMRSGKQPILAWLEAREAAR